jgi:hypothetical protein
VAPPARFSPPLVGLRPLAALPRAVGSCLAGLCACALLILVLAPAPAGALVTPIGSPQWGVEPHSVTGFAEPTLRLTYHGGPVMHSNKTYAIYWDPTSSPANQYDGDWKSLINRYFQDVGSASETLGNVNAVTSLYTDSTGHAAYRSSFLGAATDKTAYPTKECVDPTAGSTPCLTDAQLRTELSSFVTAHGLPTGMGTIFFLFTPPGVTICTDGGTATGHCSDSTGGTVGESYEHSFCSYHSFIGSGAGTILYAAQPWTAGTLGSGELSPQNGVDCQEGSGTQQEPNQLPTLDTDGDFDSGLPDVIINEISVEQMATVTDPLLNGWYAPAGPANEGNEMPDQCRNRFEPKLGGSPAANLTPTDDTEAGTLFNQSIAGHAYYLNTAYDQAALGEDFPGVACIPAVSLVPLFTAPNPVNHGEVVGFDATESNVSLGATNYEWNFGDGSKPVSGAGDASVFHSFSSPYGKTYEVSLTITDGGANTATTTNAVTVEGPPEPPPLNEGLSKSTQSTTSSSTTSSSATGAPSSGSSGAGTNPIVNPAATASIASRSLRSVLRNGLVIRYSVNERVTGRFEVLLATSLARRIGLHGSPATGLAKGTAPQTIIGRAILVTTAAGRNTVKIQFSKATAARLRRLHNPSLMLRLIVRNASAGTATVLSTIALSG